MKPRFIVFRYSAIDDKFEVSGELPESVENAGVHAVHRFKEGGRLGGFEGP